MSLMQTIENQPDTNTKALPKVMSFFGTRPEVIQFAPILNALETSCWKRIRRRH